MNTALVSVSADSPASHHSADPALSSIVPSSGVWDRRHKLQSQSEHQDSGEPAFSLRDSLGAFCKSLCDATEEDQDDLL